MICSLGFIIFDVVYVSIIMNYSFQCQLLMYHIKSIKYRVIGKEWAGIKEGQTAASTSIEPVLEKAIKVLLIDLMLSQGQNYLTYLPTHLTHPLIHLSNTPT